MSQGIHPEPSTARLQRCIVQYAVPSWHSLRWCLLASFPHKVPLNSLLQDKTCASFLQYYKIQSQILSHKGIDKCIIYFVSMPLHPPELKCVILNTTHRKHTKLHGDVTDSDTFPAPSHKVKVLNLLLSLNRHTKLDRITPCLSKHCKDPVKTNIASS